MRLELFGTIGTCQHIESCNIMTLFLLKNYKKGTGILQSNLARINQLIPLQVFKNSN
jgi:hypothetical protein